LLLMINMMMIV